MTDDLDDLLTPGEWEWRRCHVAQALDDIPDETARAKIAAACKDPRVPADNVRMAFTRHGSRVPGGSTVRRHQTGGCACR